MADLGWTVWLGVRSRWTWVDWVWLGVRSRWTWVDWVWLGVRSRWTWGATDGLTGCVVMAERGPTVWLGV
ncbi:hypothetical protein ATK86_1391 [Nocardia fluminea]|uniref:Uncharacterized protein n=1 Tax=Nocardia fluminea TaxID=134984 RepID=A0A2N3WZM1_9NOCA|nr:hypothetical protein ATK86_1391 [Nocardia fluminea]